jgi:O-antigen/teichoic acid export membrane protein
MDNTFSQKIIRGFVSVFAGSFAVRLVGFLVSIFLLRSLSLHAYGTYQLVLAAGSLFGLLLLQGLDEVIVAAVAKALATQGVMSARILSRGYFLFKCATGGAVWLLLHFGIPLLERWYSSDILQFLGLYSWVFLLIPFERTIVMYYTTRRNFVLVGAYGFVQEVMRGLLVIFFVQGLHRGIEGILYASLVAMVSVVLVFGFRPFVDLWTDSFTFSLAPFWELLRRQGIWIIGQRFIRQAEKNIRPFLIQAVAGREAVALFNVMEKMYGYISGLFPLDDVLMPNIAIEFSNRERLQRILERGIKYSVLLYGLIALVSAVCVPWLVPRFLPQYAHAVPLMLIILFYVPFVGVAYILTSFFVSHQEQLALFRIMAARMVFAVLLLLLCLSLFGIAGIAIEYTLTLLLYNFFRYRTLRRMHPELRVSLRRLWSIDSYDRAVFSRLWRRVFFFSKT